ncbi:leucine-rich repeat-containing protein 43-like [Clinocottus analis]|uniref:leucine-rich repeat-containing protein 43-like n=1 Tax=Clinocottus analis TaxID=304258 RepID=UPI0035BFBBDA
MSSNKLSAVLEKQIRRLCLNDFPCGYGTWRKTKDSPEGAETEDTDALLDLLNCPHSPWRQDKSWSPQAAALRQLAVLTPERLHTDFIYNYFTTLRIVDKDVSVIDNSLLKFSKLEELVLTDNKISEIPAENLPSSLKILELRANRLSALNSLTNCLPPRLEYLSLGSNRLGSLDDICHLTGRHWPQLVSLDLSNCDFEDQQALLSAVSTLPCLRTLVLEGNPLTLALSYPGLTVDTLPQLVCLDTSWISVEERQSFSGLAKNSDLIVDRASTTVSVGRMSGIPNPLMRVDENAPDFPVVNYGYVVTYEFLSHQTVNLNLDRESKSEAAHVTEDCLNDADLQSNKNCENDSSKLDTQDLMVYTEETCRDIAHVSRHSTSKLSWSECMDFSHTQTYTVSDLGCLKRFFNKGFYLTIEEEKVLSWPAASEDVPQAKSSRPVKEKKGGKGKASPIKSGATKNKSVDKKKKFVPELVQDAPIRRLLSSVHIPLQSLVTGAQKVDVLCDLGTLHIESEDLGKKIKEDKKKEKESKQKGGSGTKPKNMAAPKGKGKRVQEREMDVHTDDSMAVRLESMTVELTVALEKWQSASEAHQLLLPHQNS